MGKSLAKRHRRRPCRAQEVSAEFLAPPTCSCIAVGNSPIPTSLLYSQAPHSGLSSAMKSPILLLSQCESVSIHLSRHTHQVKAPLLRIVPVCCTWRLAAAFSLLEEMGMGPGHSLPCTGHPRQSTSAPTPWRGEGWPCTQAAGKIRRGSFSGQLNPTCVSVPYLRYRVMVPDFLTKTLQKIRRLYSILSGNNQILWQPHANTAYQHRLPFDLQHYWFMCQ